MHLDFEKNKDIIWNRYYLIITFILFLAVVFFSFSKPWGFADDIWETGAAISEISIHPFHPENPLIALPGNTSPRFVPYTVFWGVVKRISGLGIFTLLGIIAIVNYLIFIRGLYLFVSTKFKDKILPNYTLLVILFVWGTGFGWTNQYNLETFLISQALTGYFAFALGLNALYYLIKYLDNKSIKDLTIYSVLSIIIFITHPITSAFLFVFAISLIYEYHDFKKLALLQIVPLIAFILSLFWPYFNYWDVFTKGSIEKWYVTPVYSHQIAALGFALIGIPIIIWFYFKDRYKFLFYCLFLCFLIYTLSFFLKINIGGRFIIFSIYPMHLGISVYLKETNLFNFRTIKLSFKDQGLEIILIFLFLIYPIKMRLFELKYYAQQVIDLPFKVHSYDSPIKPYLFLEEYLSSSNIVLTDEGWGHFLFNKPAWPIPMLTGARIVALEKYNPLILNESILRDQDVHKFFRNNLTLNERKQILLKYKTTNILIDKKYESLFDHSLINQLDSLGTLLIKNGGLKLYTVKNIIFNNTKM